MCFYQDMTKRCQNLVSLGSYYGKTVLDVYSSPLCFVRYFRNQTICCIAFDFIDNIQNFKTILYGNIFRNCYSHLKVKTLCKNVMATNFIKSARKRKLFLLTSTIWCNKCFLDLFVLLKHNLTKTKFFLK